MISSPTMFGGIGRIIVAVCCVRGVGIHACCARIPDVRTHTCGRKTNEFSLSAFRHTDEAAKSRRLPRGWRGHRKPGKFLGRRLSPWKLFGSVFFAKKRNTMQYLVGCVRTDVVAVGMVRGRLLGGRGNPSPTTVVVVNSYTAEGMVRGGCFGTIRESPLRWLGGCSSVAMGTVRGDRLRTLPHPLRGSSLPEGAYG